MPLAPLPDEDVEFVLARRRWCTPVVAELTLEVAEDPIDFVPGQYMLLQDAQRWVPVRSYSVANAPRADGSLTFLVRHPERVTAVVGISPVPASGVPLDADQQALFGGAAQEHANRYAIIDLTTGNRQPKSWIDAMVAYSAEHSRPDAVAGYLEAWTGADFVADLPEVTVPVHAVVGEHDPALGEATMRATWLEQLPGCELTVLANAGHYAMFETPVSLIGAIESTLPSAG